MTQNRKGISVIGLAAIAVVALGALPAFAQTVSVSATAQAKANASAKLPAVIARGDTDIAARVEALNKLSARVQEMKNVSSSEKANIAAEVQTNISGLTALKAKIDADTDVSVARSDDQSIFTAYRIYALVIPQGWVLASADRVTTITGLMTALGAKMQARIAADQSAGKDVASLSASLSDMNAKIADANTQSASASAAVSGLSPDQGNATVAASNKAALIASRAKIKAAEQDLKAARADIKTILQGLHALGGGASGSATVTP